VKARVDLGVAALLTLGAVVASVGAALLGGRLIESGPNWWRSLVARPYLALAELGVDMGHPAFWVLPSVALLAGTIWAYAVTRTFAIPRPGPIVLAALSFGAVVFVETEAAPLWLTSLVPQTDGHERAELLLRITEAVFVVAAISSGALALSLGFGRRTIGVAIVAALSAAVASAIAYILLDIVGLRVGSWDGAMVKVALASTAAGAIAGGAMLGRALRETKGHVPIRPGLGPT
jgi:MFS family permease